MKNNRIDIQLKIGRIVASVGDISTEKVLCSICSQRFVYIVIGGSKLLLEEKNGCLIDHSIQCNPEAVKERKRNRNKRRKLKRKLNNQNNNEVKNDNTKVSTTKKLFIPQKY